MPFQKGKPKTGGKVKGNPNHRTKEAIERVEWVLGLLEPNLMTDIQALESNERVKLWNDLQEYVRPKLARITHTGDSQEPINIIFKTVDKRSADK